MNECMGLLVLPESTAAVKQNRLIEIGSEAENNLPGHAVDRKFLFWFEACLLAAFFNDIRSICAQSSFRIVLKRYKWKNDRVFDKYKNVPGGHLLLTYRGLSQ